MSVRAWRRFALVFTGGFCVVCTEMWAALRGWPPSVSLVGKGHDVAHVPNGLRAQPTGYRFPADQMTCCFLSLGASGDSNDPLTEAQDNGMAVKCTTQTVRTPIPVCAHIDVAVVGKLKPCDLSSRNPGVCDTLLWVGRFVIG